LAIEVKRIYDSPRGNGTFRILVDRLWPRGLSHGEVKVDLWEKGIGPSNSLRKWFSHDAKRWDEFRERYFEELEQNNESLDAILDIVKKEESVTLLYGAKEKKFNNAIALKEYLEKKIDK
jgi:uncharacterized protein YeaO (DUF488 family)